MAIPIIDIFAGPGGLGEGFTSLHDNGERRFKITLSIEKEYHAHQTLTLRSFVRQFNLGEIPDDYYDFVKGKITLKELYEAWPEEAHAAQAEAWNVTLGGPDEEGAAPYQLVDEKIVNALEGKRDWVLIGGPPCQAYSIMGRSRRQETTLDETTDKRVGLYKQYLRILALHSPAVFVMENVKGILSAKTKSNSIFPKILQDLSDPVAAYLSEYEFDDRLLHCPGYKIYSLTRHPRSWTLEEIPEFKPEDFIIKTEKFGIPQTRHRVILLGIRQDNQRLPDILTEEAEIGISQVLSGLPILRSKISRQSDDHTTWIQAIRSILQQPFFNDLPQAIQARITNRVEQLAEAEIPTGGDYLQAEVTVDYQEHWYLDDNLVGTCNHSARGHMLGDLFRYMYISCFGYINKKSPKLSEMPTALLPEHGNIKSGKEDEKFADRFRVQLWDRPSKTITSHISKDGHYFIHPDSTQCRSFTVREAARIQTFPDNYYFCGPRTAQFVQVGNAVPPLLANKIAQIVFGILSE